MSNAVDLAQKLTAATAGNLVKNEVTHVGRYLSRTAWKGLDAAEVSAIKAAGLQIFSIYETNPTHVEYFTASQGQQDAAEAAALAQAIGQPAGTAVYFTVDYDAQPKDFSAILTYFQAVRTTLPGYKLGCYGSYAVLTYLQSKGIGDYYFQTVAWSNGQRCPFLHIYQYQCDKTFAGLQVDMNNFEKSEVGAWGQMVLKTEVVNQDTSGPKDYATLTINYPQGYGINAYDGPNGQYVRKVSAGAYRVFAEKDDWFGIGANTWVKGDPSVVSIKRDVVKVNYPAGYGVNVYDAPGGNFVKRVNGGDSYAVYAATANWYGIGANCWIKASDVTVSK